jgi:hypothetical protein
MTSPVTFTLQFKGGAEPVADAVGVLKAQTRAAGAKETGGGEVRFSSIVTMVGDGLFVESGAIDYGGGASLTFDTVGQGRIGPAPGGGMAGAVIWKVVEAKGRFAGASGYIASNFTVSEKGEVVDNQLASLFLK